MARPDVLSRLAEGGSYPIVLLRAPAGFGKTSVLRLLHARLEAEAAPVAWLTLDRADRDPARLLLSLRAALLGEPGETNALLHTLSSTAIRHFFVDDVEHLDELTIRLLLSVVVEVLPPGMRVYLASRSLHQVSVANLKAKQILLELNMESLRFVPAETEHYLHQANLFLSDEHLRWLHHAVEGWPAAVELLVLAWKRIQGNVDNRLPDLHGVNDLSDYLAEEVLRAQPDDIQAFLVATAPLHSFCVELADCVRASNDSLDLIARIRLSGLPIQPIGEHWFRYHPLFAGHIVRLCGAADATRATVYARAAVWLARHGRELDAFDCYIKAGDLETAADVLEPLADTMRVRAQFPSLLHCCSQLPEALLRRRPRISRCLLVGLTYSSHRGDVHRWMDYFRAQSMLPDSDPAYGESLRAFEPLLGFLEGDIVPSMRLAESYWALQQDAHPYERGVLATGIATARLACGQLPQAEQMLAQARRICADSGAVTVMSVVIFLQAYLDAMQGRLEAALEQMAQIDTLQQQYSATISSALLYSYGGGLLLMVLYELNRIDEVNARMKLARGMTGISLPWGTVAGVQSTQSKLMALQEGPAVARRWLECNSMKLRKHAPPQLRMALEAELSRLVVLGGNRASISGYAALLVGEPASDDELPQWIFTSDEIDGAGIAQARLAIANGQPGAARSYLVRLIGQAEGHGRRWRAVKLKVLLALAAERDGDPAEALALMAQALEQGAQFGMVRSFLDEGDGVLRLLGQLQTGAATPLSEAAAAHLRTLLNGVAGVANPIDLPALTPAECSLLELVAQGQSNREVAVNLGLSINTVKWHMAQIFSKFNVANRVQAVNLARQAGLLTR